MNSMSRFASLETTQTRNRFTSIAPAILLGIGLGGFLDGIVLHQLLQWHSMLSNRVPPTTLEAMHLNMFWDGVFHAATWLITVTGVMLLWRSARRRHDASVAPIRRRATNRLGCIQPGRRVDRPSPVATA